MSTKTPIEVCPLCEGTGWKPLRSPNDKGNGNKDRRVTRCDCQLRSRNQSLLARARIPPRYEHCELSTFEFDGSRRSLAPARMAACRFVEEYPLRKSGLLFVGETGRGKTHLAVGIAQALIREKGAECVFYDYAELLKEIQESYNPSAQTTELGLLRPVFAAEVLVLDDLGSVRPTEWRWDTVRLILNTRYNKGLTTIITTNFPDAPATISSEPSSGYYAQEGARAKKSHQRETLGDRIGETMRSRLHEMCQKVEVGGEDYREILGCESIAVALAVCAKCGKDNIYKRVGAIRTLPSSAMRIQITCKRCGERFLVAKQQLHVRMKPVREIESEYGGIGILEWI